MCSLEWVPGREHRHYLLLSVVDDQMRWGCGEELGHWCLGEWTGH